MGTLDATWWAPVGPMIPRPLFPSPTRVGFSMTPAQGPRTPVSPVGGKGGGAAPGNVADPDDATPLP